MKPWWWLQSAQNVVTQLIFRLRRSDHMSADAFGYECRNGPSLSSRSPCRLSPAWRRIFPVAGACIWSDLPSHITSSLSLLSFKQRLNALIPSFIPRSYTFQLFLPFLVLEVAVCCLHHHHHHGAKRSAVASRRCDLPPKRSVPSQLESISHRYSRVPADLMDPWWEVGLERASSRVIAGRRLELCNRSGGSGFLDRENGFVVFVVYAMLKIRLLDEAYGCVSVKVLAVFITSWRRSGSRTNKQTTVGDIPEEFICECIQRRRIWIIPSYFFAVRFACLVWFISK